MVAFAVFYFGCNVKHLLSCSVHREHSAAYYCTCVLCKCMPDGHCCHRCMQCCTEHGPSAGKREKKKEELLQFPPQVWLHFWTVVSMLPRETKTAVERPKRMISLSFSLSIKSRICYHSNHLGENKLAVPCEVKWALNASSVHLMQCISKPVCDSRSIFWLLLCWIKKVNMVNLLVQKMKERYVQNFNVFCYFKSYAEMFPFQVCCQFSILRQ